MKSHAKRAIKHLEALGFTQDDAASNPRKGKYVYRHANDPSRPVKVFAGETDTTSTSVMRLADQIAGISTSGPTMPASIRERVRVKQANSKAQREAERRASAARAEKAELAHIDAEKARLAQQHERELRDLMNPGFGQ